MRAESHRLNIAGVVRGRKVRQHSHGFNIVETSLVVARAYESLTVGRPCDLNCVHVCLSTLKELPIRRRIEAYFVPLACGEEPAIGTVGQASAVAVRPKLGAMFRRYGRPNNRSVAE